METKASYSFSFEQAKLLKKCVNWILIISTVLLAVSFSIETYAKEYANISTFITNVNCFFIISFAILSFVIEIIYFHSSSQRREDYIDNSFDSKLAEERSKNYYTNEKITAGIYKMAVNGFENSLFTYNISKCMTRNIWFKNLIFGILVLFFAVFGFKNEFTLLIQLTLPILLLQEALRHTLFVFRIKKVFENYRKLFNDLKNVEYSENKNPEIVLNVLEYETTLTYGSILLNTTIYNRLNPILSQKWIQLKDEYNIK